MKRGAVALLIALALGVAAAAQQPQAAEPTTEAVKPAPAQAASPQPGASVSPLSQLSAEQLTQLLRRRALRRAADLMGHSGLCYTMHSFVFQRYDGGDAVRQVNEYTCAPASRFRTKSAVASFKKKK